MIKSVLVPNIVEANGKTIRENNLSVAHTIPLKTLVEVVGGEDGGIRAYVVEHSRDCDGTPLYSICLNRDFIDDNKELLSTEYGFALRSALMTGFTVDDLVVIR